MIEIVFVEPETPGNIGALARVMKNFNLTKLTLINPKCDHLDEEAKKRAKHAQDVLKKAKVIKSIKNIKADYLVGTTALTGTSYNIPRSPLTPRQFAEKAAKIKNKIALLIGRESEGLYNEEIELCDFTVTIPTSKTYGTLNASHAATILLYELFIAQEKDKGNIHESASDKDKQQIMKLLTSSMNKLDFQSKEKKDTQRKVWKRLISKSFMTKRESFALMGFLKKIK